MATFEHYCTCGGFAWQMNGRPEEYAEYIRQREAQKRLDNLTHIGL